MAIQKRERFFVALGCAPQQNVVPILLRNACLPGTPSGGGTFRLLYISRWMAKKFRKRHLST